MLQTEPLISKLSVGRVSLEKWGLDLICVFTYSKAWLNCLIQTRIYRSKKTEMNLNSLKWSIRFSERNIEKLPWKVLLVVSYN